MTFFKKYGKIESVRFRNLVSYALSPRLIA